MKTDNMIRGVALALAFIGAIACASEVVAPVPHVGTTPLAANRHATDRTPGGPLAEDRGRTEHGERASPVSCARRPKIASSGLFGPAGGTLTFGNSSLVIPGGALRDTVTITATRLGDGTSTVRFEPHGLRFYKPAGLVLDGNGCSLPSDGSPSVVYVNDDGDVLETIRAYYDPHWKTVAAPIVHFSGYAIAF